MLELWTTDPTILGKSRGKLTCCTICKYRDICGCMDCTLDTLYHFEEVAPLKDAASLEKHMVRLLLNVDLGISLRLQLIQVLPYK